MKCKNSLLGMLLFFPFMSNAFLLVEPDAQRMITIGEVTYYCHDSSFPRNGKRPYIVVLHSTEENRAKSASIFTGKERAVCPHYLISEKTEHTNHPFCMYHFTDDNRAARHAGASRWRNAFSLYTNGSISINHLSIGIELVNHGYLYADSRAPILDEQGKLQFAPFTGQQIDNLIALLLKLKKEYNIKPWNFVGHSDVALCPKTTLRKIDPGAAFPWQQLAESGIGMWPGLSETHTTYPKPQGHDLVWTKKALERLGYFINDCSHELDLITRLAINAFRLHYQVDAFDSACFYSSCDKPQKWENGQDMKTQDILYALITEYDIPSVPNSIFENRD